jgi:DNA-binding beta-propeller fold protein YncE
MINTIFAGGNFPNAIALDPRTNRLYVGFKYSNTINEINTVTNNVLVSMPIENDTQTLNMVSNQYGDLFVSHDASYYPRNASKITLIRALEHSVRPFTGSLNDTLTAMASDYIHLFVVNNLSNKVYAFNPFNASDADSFAINEISHIPIGPQRIDIEHAVSPQSLVIKHAIGPQGIAIDQAINLVYVARTTYSCNYTVPLHITASYYLYSCNQFSSVTVWKSTRPHAFIREILIPLSPQSPIVTNTAFDRPQTDAIAVNSKTHTIYVVHRNFVYPINIKCIIEGKQCDSKPIKVGEGFSRLTYIAVNPNTNMVYVTNPKNNTVSVIDGRRNKLIVGINFIIDPPNSGYLDCNGTNLKSSRLLMLDLGSLTCEAKANSVFPASFSYWSVFPPIWFDSWSGDLASPDSDKDNIITFKPTHFGTLVANFNVLSDAYITTILAIAIPAAGGLILKYSPLRDWFSQMRRDKNLNKYRNLIDDTSKIANRDKKDHIQLFEEIRKRIVDLYLNGNISDSQYMELNDELLAAMEKIKSS